MAVCHISTTCYHLLARSCCHILDNSSQMMYILLVHGQVTIIFVVSVGLSVCLFVQFFSAVFDPISIKLGHVICLGLVVSPRI